MELRHLATHPPFQATLLSSDRLTPPHADEEVRELVLELPPGAPTPDIGQSLGVLPAEPGAPGGAEHLRLYSIADLPVKTPAGALRLRITVRRQNAARAGADPPRPAITSNYLCDLQPGAQLQLTGPYDSEFRVPAEKEATLLLLSATAGIAPFRAFVRHLYERTDFRGTIWLFYGCNSGLDTAYRNREDRDLAQYYDRTTFKAFRALSPRSPSDQSIHWGSTLRERSAELWKLLARPNTYVYLAGLATARQTLETALAEIAGSPALWQERKADLLRNQRWTELLY